MLARLLFGSLVLLALCACDRKASRADPAPSASSTSPAGVRVSGAPSYALDALDEMKMAALLSKDGWKTTTVGRAPGGASERAFRAVGIKSIDGKRHDAEVLVRCPASDPTPEGSAYAEQGKCRIRVLVKIGLVVQPDASKALLERLLATKL